MTTIELIKELQKADPSGKLEVTVGKTPIYFVEQLPAYYDGCLQKLVRNSKQAPYYNVVAGVITSKGSHISIHPLSIETAIMEDPNLPVTFDLEGKEITWYKKVVDNWRKDAMMRIEENDVEYEKYD
jgi:hypothetical protein